jgi:hypothetical protein
LVSAGWGHPSSEGEAGVGLCPPLTVGHPRRRLQRPKRRLCVVRSAALSSSSARVTTGRDEPALVVRLVAAAGQPMNGSREHPFSGSGELRRSGRGVSGWGVGLGCRVVRQRGRCRRAAALRWGARVPSPLAGQVRAAGNVRPWRRSWCSERRGQSSSSRAAPADAVTSSAMASALRRVSLLTQSTCTASASVTARASCCVVARW